MPICDITAVMHREQIIHERLVAFVRESNRIEGIHREPSTEELQETMRFSLLEEVHLADLLSLLAVYQPDAQLRIRAGMNVQVGNYIPPRGGDGIGYALKELLEIANDPEAATPYDLHCQYETLHPFTDGNGRTGRALWLWHMGGLARVPLGFLHTFYYQSLSAYPLRKGAQHV